MVPKIKLSSLALLPIALSLKLPGDVGKVPALGWSSWNAYGCNIDAETFTNAASLMVSMGFKDAGYEYINIDDCWGDMAGRNNVTGELQADPTKFPGGIAAVANHTHSLGMKQGIYSSAGTETCQGYPASIGHESLDAATFASWGVDYLKYDNCYAPSNWTDTCYSCDQDNFYNPLLVNGTCVGSSADYLCPSSYNYSTCNTAERYRLMSDALLEQNRTILYSLCEWGINKPWEWGGTMAQSWRTTNDVTVNFTRILNFVNLNSFWQNYVEFYGHNDMDLLELGNGLTPPEARSQFALWAIMKSPLIISTKLENLTQIDTEILQNKYLLAFNQDSDHHAPARPYKWGINPDWTFNATAPAQYWSGKSRQGTIVALFNTQNETASMQFNSAEIPQLKAGQGYSIIDAWTNNSRGCVKKPFTAKVKGRDTAVYLVTGECK